MPVRVVTDSTADLPRDLAEAHGITVVPLNVQFSEETYRDSVDINADEFYQRLVSSPRLPTTSQPSVGAFMEAYQGVAEGADGIVSVHISAKLSGTCNSATQAQSELAQSLPIEVVDTRQASLAAGLVALAAARASQAGGTRAGSPGHARRRRRSMVRHGRKAVGPGNAWQRIEEGSGRREEGGGKREEGGKRVE